MSGVTQIKQSNGTITVYYGGVQIGVIGADGKYSGSTVSEAGKIMPPTQPQESTIDFSKGFSEALIGLLRHISGRLPLPPLSPNTTPGIRGEYKNPLDLLIPSASAAELEKPEIQNEVNSGYRTSNATRPAAQSDPLAIDLDGDGIETTGVTGTPVLFDHNADGVRTGTGWVKGDDAWLVLDRNGNGTIDSGRELFGVDTLISGTPEANPVYASTGFEALKTLDKGNGTVGSAGYGDNLFDSRDAAFAQVRLWQDVNQDGVSQADELFTLAQKGIISIGLTPSTGTINLGNGNTVSGTATVVRAGQSNTVAGAVKVASDTTAFNLFLGQNPFYREFPAIPVTTTAQALPDMGGSGWVRDLREAMSLGTAQGNALAAKVQAFAAATTRDAQRTLLDDLLRLWAETNQSHAVPGANDPTRRFVLAGDATTSAKLQAAIPVLEVFNGMNVDDAGMQVPVLSTVSGQTVRTYNLFANQAPTMLQAYEALRESVYSALVVQTLLKPYPKSILTLREDTSDRCTWWTNVGRQRYSLLVNARRRTAIGACRGQRFAAVVKLLRGTVEKSE